jgi:hypothetical protein
VQVSLKEAGFQLDLSPLWTTRRTNRRLPNGRFVVEGSRSGSNSVTIDNGYPDDVVVALALGSKPAMSVYTRSRSSFSISGVPNGDYRFYVTSGKDWDAKHRTFTRSCSFRRLSGSLNLTANGFQYTIGTLNLGGKRQAGERPLKSSSVAPQDFPGGPG